MSVFWCACIKGEAKLVSSINLKDRFKKEGKILPK